MKALIRVRTVYSPARKPRGFQLQATVPNKQGKKFVPIEVGGDVEFRPTNQVVPSFAKPYLIRESSCLPNLTRADYDRLVEALKWEGFSEFEPYGAACNALLA